MTAANVVGVPSAIFAATVLVAGLLALFADRLRKQRALQEDLFQQTRDAVVLLTGDYRVVRVNRAFTALFGYGPECAGQPLESLIVPPEERLFFERNRAETEAGRRVDAEGLRRRKDGAIIPVSIALRRVSVPAEGVDICATYVDISERKAAEEARRAFPGRLIEMQELERKHIARELHDEIGQVLTSATMILSLSRQLPAVESQKRTAEACALLDELIGKVRGLALDLRPSVLDHFGLAAALTGFFQRFTAQTGVHVVFRDFDTDGRRFSSETETAAYRIVQEALTNVARHAKVQEATVTVLAEDRFLRIEVEDRGEGFDTHEVCAAEAFGLNGMRERAALLGGRFIVRTSLGSGTRIVAELPLPTSSGTG